MRKPANFQREGIWIGVFLMFFAGTSLLYPGMLDDSGVIRQRMESLGFMDGKIVNQKGGNYVIKVRAYVQRSQALSLNGLFRPFEVQATFSQGILFLEKTDLERAGFSVHEEFLPRGIKIVRKGISRRSLPKQTITDASHIQRIERALEKTKRNRNKVHSICMEVVTSLNQTFSLAFPDVCKTPTPGGPVPIPYPNISMSSDLPGASKKVKVDGAEIIAKHSDFKMSEGDEVGTRARGLQKVYLQTIGRRELSTEEKAKVKRELKDCLEKSKLLMKTLDRYVEEIEKLLRQTK